MGTGPAVHKERKERNISDNKTLHTVSRCSTYSPILTLSVLLALRTGRIVWSYPAKIFLLILYSSDLCETLWSPTRLASPDHSSRTLISVVQNTFKSISITNYKLHFQVVFQILFSISLWYFGKY